MYESVSECVPKYVYVSIYVCLRISISVYVSKCVCVWAHVCGGLVSK